MHFAREHIKVYNCKQLLDLYLRFVLTNFILNLFPFHDLERSILFALLILVEYDSHKLLSVSENKCNDRRTDFSDNWNIQKNSPDR